VSTGNVSHLSSSRNVPASLSVFDTLCKVIVETGGGMFVGVCRSARLVLWRSPATCQTLYCSIDGLSADVVRKQILESDSQFAVTQVEL
jgi:hypothetical protein